MDEIRLIYAAEGGRGDAFHTEAFGPVSKVPPAEEVGQPSAMQYQLLIGNRQLGVQAGETVLQAALRQGVIIPCGCGQGICGTCRVERISGDIDLRHDGGLSPDEEKAGYILACSSRLRSDCEIRIR